MQGKTNHTAFRLSGANYSRRAILPARASRKQLRDGLPGRLESFSNRRHHFEQVADDPIIGYFEDWRLGILVDRHDALRSLHPYEVLDGSGNAHREVELGRNSLSGTADLALHGKPAVVADGTR